MLNLGKECTGQQNVMAGDKNGEETRRTGEFFILLTTRKREARKREECGAAESKCRLRPHVFATPHRPGGGGPSG